VHSYDAIQAPLFTRVCAAPTNQRREIMDAMDVPEGYASVYGWSFMSVFGLTLPHSTAVQVAWPDQALTNGGCCVGLLNGVTARERGSSTIST
jgi:hypothetical protein